MPLLAPRIQDDDDSKDIVDEFETYLKWAEPMRPIGFAAYYIRGMRKMVDEVKRLRALLAQKENIQ